MTVYFNPQISILNLGDVFSIDLMADIPDAVYRWGLDVSFDPAILSLTSPPAIGPDWIPALAPAGDGDGLAGLGINPSGIAAPEIVLATLTFQYISWGTSDLVASYTLGDPEEGFLLAFPAGTSGFAEVSFQDGKVQPIPEPATMLLLASGLAGLAAFRRRFSKK